MRSNRPALRHPLRGPRRLRWPALALIAGAALLLVAPVAALAQASADVVSACEQAVRQALPVGERHDVSFNAPPAVQPAMSDGSRTVLRGAGRVRSASGSRGFTYSCNVDPRSDEAVGVMLRRSPAAAETVARAQVDPDLSQLSPLACESRAAEALKQRWPRVSQISFDANTRQLRQDVAGRAELRGQGRALPTPISPTTFFEFDCAIDAKDGRVLSARVSG